MNAQTFEDFEDNNDEFLVPPSGDTSPAWANVTAAKQQDAKELALPQHFGEDARDRCLEDAAVGFFKHLKTKEKNMTINKWIGAFPFSLFNILAPSCAPLART